MSVGVEALFTSALGLQLPWTVEDVKLDTVRVHGVAPSDPMRPGRNLCVDLK
jgi:hypothetical protein